MSSDLRFKCKKCMNRVVEDISVMGDGEDEALVTCKKCGAKMSVRFTATISIEIEDVELEPEPADLPPEPGELWNCPDCEFPVRVEEYRGLRQLSDAEGPRERLTHVCVLTQSAMREAA